MNRYKLHNVNTYLKTSDPYIITHSSFSLRSFCQAGRLRRACRWLSDLTAGNPGDLFIVTAQWRRLSLLCLCCPTAAPADCAAVLQYRSESPGLPDCFQQPPPVMKEKLHRFHPVLVLKNEERFLMVARLRCRSQAESARSGLMRNDVFIENPSSLSLSFPNFCGQLKCWQSQQLLFIGSYVPFLPLRLAVSPPRYLLFFFYLFAALSHIHTWKGTSRTNYGPTITPPPAPLRSRLRNKFIGTSLPLL